MRRSKSGHEKNHSNRRRSWFNGSNIFTSMFSSAPPSPERRAVGIFDDPSLGLETQQHHQRSNSLTPIDRFKHKTSFSSMLHMKQHKRKESSTLSRDSQSSIFDYSSSLRRSSSKSDATTISDMDMNNSSSNTTGRNNEPNYFQKTQQRQLLKSDEEEADRIQLKNDLVKLAFEGEFSLPFDYKELASGRILDLGCGPGSWCIDLAQKYPRIEVIGVDSEDMFPSQHNLPSNCQLRVCNALNGLTEFPDASFDVIHIRFMVLSFTGEEYPQVVKDCWRLLKPGGYLEILETDLTVYSPGPMTKKLNEEMLQVASSRRLEPKSISNNLSALIPAEGENRQVKYRSIPIGIWGGRIGVLCRDDMINMLTKFQPVVYEYFGKGEDEKKSFDQEIATVIREMEQYRSFSNYYFYTAQKPNTPTTTTTTNTSNTITNTTTNTNNSNANILKRNFTAPSINPKSF